jgi:hypothetical protein
MRIILLLAWRAIKPSLTRWLTERALRLPTSARNNLATRLNIDPTCIDAIQNAIQDYALAELEQYHP